MTLGIPQGAFRERGQRGCAPSGVLRQLQRPEYSSMRARASNTPTKVSSAPSSHRRELTLRAHEHILLTDVVLCRETHAASASISLAKDVDVRAVPVRGETVVILGGGMTAAQLACAALEHGAAQVGVANCVPRPDALFALPMYSVLALMASLLKSSFYGLDQSGSALITQGHSATESAERPAYCSKKDTSDTGRMHECPWVISALPTALRSSSNRHPQHVLFFPLRARERDELNGLDKWAFEHGSRVSHSLSVTRASYRSRAESDPCLTRGLS